MPAIFEYLGIVFGFFANDHPPIHVHAKYGECVTIFVLVYKSGKFIGVKTRTAKGKRPLPKNKLIGAEKFVYKYHEQITEKWEDFYVKDKKVKKEVITKKIS